MSARGTLTSSTRRRRRLRRLSRGPRVRPPDAAPSGGPVVGGIPAEDAGEERPGGTVRVGVFGQCGGWPRLPVGCLAHVSRPQPRPRGAPRANMGSPHPCWQALSSRLPPWSRPRRRGRGRGRGGAGARAPRDARRGRRGGSPPPRPRGGRSRSRGRCRRGRAGPRPASPDGTGTSSAKAGQLRTLVGSALPRNCAVQLGHLRVVAEEEADLVLVGVAPDRRQRRARRPLGDGGEAGGLPARVLDDGLDGFRHRPARAAPS